MALFRGVFLRLMRIFMRKMSPKRGYNNIRLMCLVGAPEGVKAIEEACPNVPIYLASLDEKLNEKGYILPGLGDAGDRIFGTK